MTKELPIGLLISLAGRLVELAEHPGGFLMELQGLLIRHAVKLSR